MEQSNLSKRLLTCSWLNNCGTEKNCSYDFDVQFVADIKEALKHLSSLQWENICLEEYGNLTAYLSKYHKEEYRQTWNNNVKKLKSDILPQILSKISETAYYDDFSDDLKFNLLAIIMCNRYSNYYTSDFFDKLLKVYLSGHIPCGWSGKYPNGKLLVF